MGEQVSKQATMGILLSSFFSTTFCYWLSWYFSFLYSYVILVKWVLLILRYMYDILSQLLLVLILVKWVFQICFQKYGYINFIFVIIHFCCGLTCLMFRC